jgi:WD40 repeat protein
MQNSVVWADPLICSLSLSGDLNFLDINSPERPVSVVQAHHGPVTTVSFSPCGSLFTGDNTGVVQEWNGDVGRRIAGDCHSANISGSAVGGGRVTTVGWDNAVRSAAVGSNFDVSAALPAQPVDIVGNDPVLSVVISRNAIYTVTGSSIVTCTKATEFDCKSVALSPGNDQIVVGGSDSKVHVFPLAGDQIGDECGTLQHSGGYVSAVAYSPDGTHIVSGDSNNKIILWDRESLAAKIQGRWNLHGTTVSTLAFSACGQFVASGSADNNIFIWNTEQKSKFTKIPFAHKGGVFCVTFGAANTTLYSVGNDSCVRTWDIVLPE